MKPNNAGVFVMKIPMKTFRENGGDWKTLQSENMKYAVWDRAYNIDENLIENVRIDEVVYSNHNEMIFYIEYEYNGVEKWLRVGEENFILQLPVQFAYPFNELVSLPYDKYIQPISKNND